MRILTPARARTLRGKTCLVRVDFNIESREDAFRLETTLPTLRLLLKNGARLVLLSHRGRPERADSRFSLKSYVPFLRKRLGVSVRFFPHLDIAAIRRALFQDKKTRLFFLENLRFHPGESKNEKAFARELASFGDAYVNEAFAVSHRKSASVAALPRLLPAYAGLRLAEEVHALTGVMAHPRHPLILILGGVKVSDKLGMITYFLRKADRILVGGATANTLLKARGLDIGASLFEPDMVPAARRLLRAPNIILPFDFVSEKRKLLDIGPRSAESFSREIKKARTIIWNGPMGLFEDRRFRTGSETVARAVKASRAYSVAGGGETSELLGRLRMRDAVDFLSTGGGAMLAFLAGEKLPGITALN